MGRPKKGRSRRMGRVYKPTHVLHVMTQNERMSTLVPGSVAEWLLNSKMYIKDYGKPVEFVVDHDLERYDNTVSTLAMVLDRQIILGEWVKCIATLYELFQWCETYSNRSILYNKLVLVKSKIKEVLNNNELA